MLIHLFTFHCGSAKELLENGTFRFSIRFKAPKNSTSNNIICIHWSSQTRQLWN